MIFGIGIDIAKTSRFEKWVENPQMIRRFFNQKEIIGSGNGASCGSSMGMAKSRMSALCQHYAARFAAKEAFSKALGTGIVFDLRDVYIVNGKSGKPELVVEKSAREVFQREVSRRTVFRGEVFGEASREVSRLEASSGNEFRGDASHNCADLSRARVFVSMSHEKEFAVSQVIIEID